MTESLSTTALEIATSVGGFADSPPGGVGVLRKFMKAEKLFDVALLAFSSADAVDVSSYSGAMIPTFISSQFGESEATIVYFIVIIVVWLRPGGENEHAYCTGECEGRDEELGFLIILPLDIGFASYQFLILW